MSNLAYIYIAKQFYRLTGKYKQQERIMLQEYSRDKWTFHVKGLWYYLRNDTLPSMTIVGSANFGKSCFGLKKVCNKTSLSNI
jgi:CDP-diacylglycerol--glycerol-3-phosphate 3-phosphatidyltransferase